MKDEIRIGISSCLLGEEVRFDGGHKKNDFVTGSLAAWVSFVPVCPEVEIGLGTPRESMRLIALDGGVRMVAPKSGADHTQKMRSWAKQRLEALAEQDLSGYILKKDSPSCGMERVKVYGNGGMAAKSGRGIFAAALLERFPLIPVEEEGRLQDAVLRDNFIERVFGYRRVNTFFSGRWNTGDLVRFHTREKLLLLAHDPASYARLGRLVAAARSAKPTTLAGEYQRAYMEALCRPATPRKHTNVLQHMAGYFKKSLEGEAKAELQAVIADYHRGLVPLIVPITLIRHHVRMCRVAYLEDQVYLSPHPKELMLRNHV